MDGIHDLGGKQGFGTSLAERDEAVFHATWEKRVFALAGLLLGTGCFVVDAFRHAIERVDPTAYLADGYYGRWLGALERLEREARERGGLAAGRFPLAGAGRALEHEPRFRVGDRVATRDLQRAGHTRLPAYARRRQGVVEIVQGGWVLPDTRAHGQGEHPQCVYAVRFTGESLWGETAEPRTSVCLDLFESYLEPA